MADIKHDSEESLTDFDIIELNILEQKREMEREKTERNNDTTAISYNGSSTDIENMHDEMDAYWLDDFDYRSMSTDEKSNDSDDNDFVSGWYSDDFKKRRGSDNHSDRMVNPTNEQIMLQIRKLHDRMDSLENLLSDFNYVVDTISELHDLLIKMKQKK